MLITKTQSEVYFGTLTDAQLGVNVIIYVPAINYYGANASIGIFQYSTDLGVNWKNCTQAATQLEADLNNIPINELSSNCGKRAVPLVWYAANDLSILNPFTNVKIKVTFYDQPNQAGTESENALLTIDEIDMVPTETIVLSKPYTADNVMQFLFDSVVAIYDIETHFRLQIAAETDTDFSNPLLDFKSEAVQAGWTLSSGAFPITGAPTVKSIADVSPVTFTDASIDALPNAPYNMRILRSLHDPPKPPTYPDEW